MKKIMIIQHYGGVTGSSIGLLTTINALKDKYNVVVYCPRTPRNLGDYYKELGIQVVFYDFIGIFKYYNGAPRPYLLHFLYEFPRVILAIGYWKKLIRKESPDLVLVNSMVLSWMCMAVKWLPCKIVCHIRETLPDKLSIFRYLMEGWLERFDGVMFISEYDQKKHNLKKVKTAIIRDSLRRDEPNRKQDFHIWNNILYVGGASKIKGFETFLLSINYIQSKCAITVAGYVPDYFLDPNKKLPRIKSMIDPYFKRVKKLLKEPSICSRITFVGHSNDITLLYDKCDMLISPFYVAHQSRPALEAGEFYKPVVGSDHEATAESLINNYNAITFSPNSPKGLAKCIDYLYKNSEYMFKLGKNNHDLTIEKHAYNIVKKETLKFIDSVLSE